LAVTAYDSKDYVEIKMLRPFKQEFVGREINTMELPGGEERHAKLDMSHLNTEEAGSLKKLCSEFPSIFQTKGNQLTFTNAVTHSIPTTDDIPIYKKPYRYGFKQREEMKNQIQELLEQEVIRHSHSPWSAAVWLVPKKMDLSGK